MLPDTSKALQIVLAMNDFTELKAGADYLIDLKYGTTDNFMNENVYREFNRAFLHKLAAEKFFNAVKNLKKEKPKFKFIVFDVLRPRSIQWLLWNKVKGTDQQKYIANPESGSNHNYGMAIDLSILDENNNELDMGTAFDEFADLSQPKLESQFIEQNKLTSQQIKNRLLLRGCMESAGFKQLSTEWWHFDALPKAEIREHYKIVE